VSFVEWSWQRSRLRVGFAPHYHKDRLGDSFRVRNGYGS